MSGFGFLPSCKAGVAADVAATRSTGGGKHSGKAVNEKTCELVNDLWVSNCLGRGLPDVQYECGCDAKKSHSWSWQVASLA